jgi:hypothetical protein
MKSMTLKSWCGGLLLGCVIGLLAPTGQIRAEDGTESFGGIAPKTWILGARFGFAPLTQELTEGTSTSIGPLDN